MDRDEAFADILLDRTQRGAALADRRDRALLTELVMGTLRRRGFVDRALSPCVPRPLDRADAVSRNALRLGAYQLLFLRLPPRAAVYETVAAVKAVRGEKAAGFVNAALRALLRAGAPPPPGADAADAAPLSLVDALARSLGADEAARFLDASLEKPPFTVRANPFRASREALLAAFAAAGADPAPCRYAPDGVVLGRPHPVHSDPAFRAGEYVVMDEGAQLVSPLLSPAPGDRILDACAAPGGKSTHMAAMAAGKARIVAADASPGRARLLEEAIARTGAAGLSVVVHDFAQGPLPGSAGAFDKVLVDAPCTGTGVVRRNPDAKWRFAPDAPARMAGLQRAILANAWISLAPGGLLAYCTCSVLREENEDVVTAFLAGDGFGAAMLEGPRAWPGPADAVSAGGLVRLCPQRHGTDGFFVARIRKARRN